MRVAGCFSRRLGSVHDREKVEVPAVLEVEAHALVDESPVAALRGLSSVGAFAKRGDHRPH